MKIGTKSVLFGCHQFAIHPWFVALAWTKLYGFPWDPRLWVAFFVHDLGYWGKPNMDGPEGETHVELGANIMHWLFDRPATVHLGLLTDFEADGQYDRLQRLGWRYVGKGYMQAPEKTTWRDFCLYHSRFYAKRDNKPYSKLCVADKLAIALTPWWIYLPLVNLTGEIHEYMALSESRTAAGEPKYAHMKHNTKSGQKNWYFDVQHYLTLWVEEHKELKEDNWTPNMYEN